ncbi:pyrroloquinoline quinone biosynthesis peptide chaperone PqqD [Sphaerotilus sulfidivorans]|uniref:pyrroloquinoline quinone biosynthesis peptide chaperone PqqD n=1 Tax=Sphaerotilus sp. FB-3 TaxID=2913396 RepID=UPI00203B0DDA|nr:pyrroloquinoline quinone biosynthesis peptide chaperone PqqD [Sphaerotilus sp. FB-3]GKQ57415.1 coenzyme PQQ synthesis protein D [Sphaerotilus sp. FB-3]
MSEALPVGMEAVPRIGRGFRLQWEEAQGCHVLLYPEGMVKLNRSAGEILTRCTGTASVAEIVADLEAAFGATGLQGDVERFLDMARQQRWVELA